MVVSLDSFVLLACLGSTLYMAGVIAFVQMIHYPLFDSVGRVAFPRYHAEHCTRTSHVVALPMIVEFFSSVFLVVRPPEGVGIGWPWAGLAIVLISCGSTAFASVPLHDKLSRGFDPSAYRLLVRSNWIRFLSWNGHAIILLVMTARAIERG